MATPTYVPIASATTSSSQSSVTLTGLSSAGYFDYVLFMDVQSSQSIYFDVNPTGKQIWSSQLFAYSGTPSTVNLYSGNGSPVYFMTHAGNRTQYKMTFISAGSSVDIRGATVEGYSVGGVLYRANLGFQLGTDPIDEIVFSTGGAFTDGSTFRIYGLVA